MSRPGQREVDALLRSDFSSFLRRTFSHLNSGQVFRDNWHLRAVHHHLEAVERGGARLIINVPPRSLKSISISVAYVAWRLGQDPSLKFVCVSYANDLSSKLARDCRLIMQSTWYRRVFPNTVLARIAEMDFETTAGGGRFSTSIGGTLTGRGGDIIVIDDPIKPSEAMSAAARATVIDWFGTTLQSRLDDKLSGSIIVVMQRVHEDDLTGHLMQGVGWDLLSLPAIAEVDEAVPIGNGRFHYRKPGDLLHADRETQALLDQLKGDMGSANFAAQYQQAPVPAGGNMIQRAWLRTYDRQPELLAGDTIVQSWDCASKDGVLNDFSACVTALIRPQEIYVLDVWRGRVQMPGLMKQVGVLARRWGPDALLIEDTASGTALIQLLKHTGVPGAPRPLPITPRIDKVTRLSAASHRIEAGELLLPIEAPWLADFERELLSFPSGRTDDQVDALSQLLNWLILRRTFSAPAGPVSFTLNSQTGHMDVLGDTWWERHDHPEDEETVVMRKWG